MYYGNLGPTKMIDLAAAATNAGVAIPLYYDNVKDFSIHWECTGTVSGTWQVEVSNDPRALFTHFDHANAYWEDLTATFALTDPAGAAADEMIAYSNGSFGYIRLSYTHLTGTGILWANLVGNSQS